MFEFDPAKSQANKVKHDIDFVEAQSLWDDPHRLEMAARLAGEPRFLIVGLITGVHWSAVITYRAPNIRIISVRRSRREEVASYETAHDN
jgi:uncharacterized protein